MKHSDFRLTCSWVVPLCLSLLACVTSSRPPQTHGEDSGTTPISSDDDSAHDGDDDIDDDDDIDIDDDDIDDDIDLDDDIDIDDDIDLDDDIVIDDDWVDDDIDDIDDDWVDDDVGDDVTSVDDDVTSVDDDIDDIGDDDWDDDISDDITSVDDDVQADDETPDGGADSLPDDGGIPNQPEPEVVIEPETQLEPEVVIEPELEPETQLEPEVVIEPETQLEPETPGDDSGDDPVRGGEPLTAPAQTWTWLPLDTLRCANRSTTGIGVNLVAGSTEVVIFMDGGGGCTNPLVCLALGVRTNFGSADFTARVAELSTAGFFQRGDADNPLAGMSWVYVPYCTGDVHAGNHELTGTGDLAFVGHKNMLAVLQRLQAAYTALDVVVLAGGSAGGFGTLFNFHDTALSFPEADVVLLNDSGPLLGPDWMTPNFQNLTFGTWEVQAGIPEQCPQVTPGTIHFMYDCLAALHPQARMGLVTSDADSVNRSFLALPSTTSVSEQNYRLGIENLVTHLAGLDPWFIFVLESSTAHVLGLSNPLSSVRVPDDPSGTTLSDFMRGVITGNGATNVP